jgi:hypothetical protein
MHILDGPYLGPALPFSLFINYLCFFALSFISLIFCLTNQNQVEPRQANQTQAQAIIADPIDIAIPAKANHHKRYVLDALCIKAAMPRIMDTSIKYGLQRNMKFRTVSEGPIGHKLAGINNKIANVIGSMLTVNDAVANKEIFDFCPTAFTSFSFIFSY